MKASGLGGALLEEGFKSCRHELWSMNFSSSDPLARVCRMTAPFECALLLPVKTSLTAATYACSSTAYGS